MRAWAIAGAVALFCGGLLARGGADEGLNRDREGQFQEISRVHRSFPAGGIRGVRAKVQVGPLHVFTDSPGAIEVTAVRRVKGGSAEERRRWQEETRVLIQQQDSALVVEDIVPRDLEQSRAGKPDSRLEVEIHMPPGLALESSTGVGDIEVAGEVGNLSVKSGVGNERLRQLRCSGDRIEVNTGVGNVTMALASLPRDRVNVQVGVGKVQFSLSSRARASVDMTTGVGSVTSGVPLAPVRRSRSIVGGSLSGDLNGGGTPIQIHLGTGDARLGE